MSEWWTYRPEDFLLFSPRVYWRMFELANMDWAPLPALMLAAGVVLLLLAVLPAGHPARAGAGTFTALALAAVWAFVAYAFIWRRYAVINWAAVYAAPAFAFEALLFALAALRGFAFTDDTCERVPGAILLAVAVIAYPLLAPLAGRPIEGAEIFGMAPDPTAIATLGVLLAARGRMVPWLAVIPLAWCALSALTLDTMDESQSMAPGLAAVVTLSLLVRRALAPREGGASSPK